VFFIGEGEYDFYMFQPEEEQEDFQVSSYTPHRLMDDMRLFIDSSSPYNEYEPPNVPPQGRPATPKQVEESLPVYRIIPFVAKTEVPVNIPRKHLEDYMDRYKK